MGELLLRRILATGMAIALLLSASAAGSQPAFDSAADSAYNSGWTQGSNGGFGWGAGWDLHLSAPQYTILGDSTTNGNGDIDADGDINSPRAAGGRAWGLLTGSAIRSFSSALSIGQTFSLDFDDSGGISSEWNSSAFLLSPTGSRTIGFRANVASTYYITNANTTLNTGVTESGDGLHVAFTQLSSGIQVSMTPYASGVTTVDFMPFTGQISGFEFQSSTVGSPTTPQLTPYINNIAITPEPCTVTLGFVAALPLLARRKRTMEAHR